MRPGVSPESRFGLSAWRVCVCVLLILLIIYNPFCTLSGSYGELSYEKLARNRATLGASELQHFSPVSDPQVPNDLDVVLPGAEVLNSIEEDRFRRDDKDSLAPEPAMLGHVWFRPPPSL